MWPDGSYFEGDWFENKINGYVMIIMLIYLG